ncbi:MAG: hypothetical protein AB2604_01610 [Candidatus Thiodiazotropha taylori]
MKNVILVVIGYLFTPIAYAECPSFWDYSNFAEPNETQYLFGGGPIDGLASAAQSLLLIGTGTDKNNATAKYTVTTSGAADLPELGDTRWIPGCNHSLSFALSSPIDKSDNITDLATLDGLANAFTFSVSYTQYRDRIRRIHPGMVEGELELKQHYFWGMTATIGRENFDYVNLENFEKKDTNETPWAISLFFGGDIVGWTVTGRVRFEESYKDQNNTFRCRPLDNTTDLNCVSGPPGPPTEQEGHQVSIEFRRLITGKIGIAPAIHRDFEKSVTGINIPVFLWQDTKGQLTGGFRVGWRNDTDDTEFGLFISQPF